MSRETIFPPPGTSTLPGVSRVAALCVCLVAAACASTGTGGADAPSPGADASAESPRPEAANREYAEADVRFMQGMIHHHAQAVAMARLVPGHAGTPSVERLAARILSSQRTEIEVMADWLRDRDEPVPEIAARAVEAAEASASGDGPAADGGGEAAAARLAPPGGWDAGPQMPGVLSDAKMERLEAAGGQEFDRLFLTYMIDHHAGAVTMVKKLVDSPRGAREESVFRLASGIRADQSTEIDRMRSMLRDVLFGTESP